MTQRKIMLYESIPDSLYKYLDLEGAKKMLLNKTIKFTNPNDFNNPFDFYNELIDYPVTNDYLSRLVKKDKSLSREQRRKLAKPSAQKSARLEKVLAEGMNSHKENFRVSCFSEVSDEILMWSHYANKHQGVCIEMSISQFGEIFFGIPVNYTNSITKINYHENSSLAIENWITTKYKKWEYEKEFRLINDQKEEYIKFETEKVKKVIFGCKTPPKTTEEIILKLVEDGYKKEIFYRMELDDKLFKLNEIKIQVD